jgi:hypothetical protein
MRMDAMSNQYSLRSTMAGPPKVARSVIELTVASTRNNTNKEHPIRQRTLRSRAL